jgi:hypothetical protein
MESALTLPRTFQNLNAGLRVRGILHGPQSQHWSDAATARTGPGQRTQLTTTTWCFMHGNLIKQCLSWHYHVICTAMLIVLKGK